MYKKMTNAIKFFLTLVFFQLTGYAQNKIDISIDYACFSSGDSLSRLELYYNLYPASRQITNRFEFVNACLAVVLNDTSNKQIFSKSYKIDSKIAEDSSVHRSLAGQLKYFVKPGKYILLAYLIDRNNTDVISDTSKLIVTVPAFNSREFFISGIELADQILESTDTTSLFYKNTFEVTPNPGLVYGTRLPVVFYYCELYNLMSNIGVSELKMETVIFDARNNPVLKKTILIPRMQDNIVQTGFMNVSKLSPGSYTFTIILVDSIKKIARVQSKKIFIYSPEKTFVRTSVIGEDDYMASEFGVYNEDELDEVFARSKYIAGREEIQKWDKLAGAEAKRKFLYSFWLARDKTPETKINEYKNEYFRRVAYSNEKFTALKKKGWLTDRGRIYILYGEPSEIERFPNEVDKKPYEIWNYNQIEGGVIFVFANLAGFSDYMLLHSTMRGEPRDENWMQRIQIL